MNRLFRLTCSAVCVFVLTNVANADPTGVTDRADLLKDVHKIIAPGGIPGDIVVFGKDAITLVTGQMGKANVPVFGAAHYGTGRVVLGGHEGFFGNAALKEADNARFAANISGWLAHKSGSGIRVVLVGQSPELKQTLTLAGYSVTDASVTNVTQLIEGAHVLWLNQSSLDGRNRDIDFIRNWVKRGGGLAITGPAWGWQSINKSRDLSVDHSGNRIVMPMGLAFGSGMLGGRRGEGYDTDPGHDTDSSAIEALSDLEQHSTPSNQLTLPQLSQITTVLGQAINVLPASQSDYVKRVTALCADKGGQIPTKQAPITTTMPFARLKASLDILSWKKLAPEAIKAHPAAAAFPGSVRADANRVTKTVIVDTRVPEWHSLGLYAAPGEVITIKIPSAAEGRGMAVRIGSHTDTLWQLDKWERFPEISMSRPLNDEVNRVASPFGGTIFIEVPQRFGMDDIEVTVTGAVEAPHFVRGVTSRSDWLKSIRSAPGPWAEMEGKLVVLSVPSSSVRDLDDPDALMAYWDEVMENCYALYAAPKRKRPERYCVDRQISAGYMHSGYPIMTWEDVAKTFCDLPVLRGKTGIKCWGFYHEMGHNFQRPEWTWSAFGEVTNNLFSLYGTEKMNGVMVGAHPSMTKVEIDKRVHTVSEAPGAEAYYSKDPWMPLTMFWLMRQEFGWEPFTKLFAEFRDLPNSARPRTEQEKHDQFLERMSRLTGRNLSQYLKAWGVELSSKSQNSVSSLPAWMPKEWKVQ